jgi:hypothetical protein
MLCCDSVLHFPDSRQSYGCPRRDSHSFAFIWLRGNVTRRARDGTGDSGMTTGSRDRGSRIRVSGGVNR